MFFGIKIATNCTCIFLLLLATTFEPLGIIIHKRRPNYEFLNARDKKAEHVDEKQKNKQTKRNLQPTNFYLYKNSFPVINY